jgi:hypothetical protein
MQNYGSAAPPPAGGHGPIPQPKKGISKGVIIAVVAVVLVGGFVLLVALGVGGYFLFRQRAHETAAVGAAPASGFDAPVVADGPGGESVEGPSPTAAQAAAVAGGQEAEWAQQEMSWTVPQRWSKNSADSTTFLWRSPGSWDAASLIVSVSPMDADFPAEISLNAFYAGAEARKSRGEVNEVRWLVLGGVKGVMFREAAPEDSDSPQRLQWMAYRNYKGQQQLVNIMLASRGKDFARHEDALYGILYSTELSK